ncbi:hypothetical protein M4D55_10715 [Metabacillus idriensis]|uniref:LysM domain-containing protein n=1 Tax=Metabacillus idriensis TaxID=324768 RepID=A0A6I2MHP5_9BACI|nr:hypothetical protein [Metabacillus idriensis]MCM3596245.1 hypothetical protein [Metabacillus idriensis]MRX55991.1 hypothetical protein [Metabacillus idriensis]OHR73941.1 hypothetical protein HMPREF3291_04980 [Bacillus sp. HMSC76G11]
MKRLMIFILFIFLMYIVYYDMNSGTISINPQGKVEEPAAEAVSAGSKPYTEKKISQGETVLTIVEQLHKQFPVPIDQIRQDFEKLNPNVKADTIQVGKTYKFPLYEKEVAS